MLTGFFGCRERSITRLDTQNGRKRRWAPADDDGRSFRWRMKDQYSPAAVSRRTICTGVQSSPWRSANPAQITSVAGHTA